MMFAISLPALMAAVGVASDFAIYNMKLESLQNAADQAAIGAARELGIATSQKSAMQATASSYAAANLGDIISNVRTSVVVGEDKNQVTVELEETWTPFFAHFIGAKIMPVVASATAALQGESNICVLAVSKSDDGAITLKHAASVVAKGCSVYSNSASSRGISLAGKAVIDAKVVCSVGGVADKSGGATANITSDCPPIPDPLAARPVPSFGACDHVEYTVNNGSVSLAPGVYCGGLKISGSAQVTFGPGDYIIQDGAFEVSGNASARGTDVGFYLTGDLSVINFAGNAEIDLEGRKKGDLAGLLFFEDPKSIRMRQHKISSNRAHTLTGTIYLPMGSLLVDPNAKVGENSAYTAIIVQQLMVLNGPNLVLNSNYSATSVPVPEGVRASSQIVLVE